MSFKCDMCKEEFYSNEEVWGFNCNGEEVSLEAEDIELNAQNPDYWVKTLCNNCFLDDLELDKDKGISEWEQVIEIIDNSKERMI
ncbi:MAG: hypothetical protein ACRDD7_07245 [Peptostreptococcaceae bacterium]